MGHELELKMKGWRGPVTLLGIGLVLASVIRELSLPAGQRTWHGKLFEVVPYDLRLPEPKRIARTLWDPDNTHILVPTAFGVGWSFNLAGLRHRFASCG
ncbi:MAG TPA: DUF5808 domain-containing protein [Chloroflexota bacterium]